jgi:hypothetical protein
MPDPQKCPLTIAFIEEWNQNVHIDSALDWARTMERRGNVLRAALRGLVAHPYPADLMQIRRLVRDLGNEVEARASLSAYCTETFAVREMEGHLRAVQAARAVLKGERE